MVERTCIESLKSIIEIRGEEYLRTRNEEETARLLEMGASKGFPEMLGSIACIVSGSFSLRHCMGNSKENVKMQI